MSRELDELLSMMTYKRPAGSETEQDFRRRFLEPLGVGEDRFGNLHLTIGDNPTILWSSHTDSVHRGEGKQKIDFDGGRIVLGKKSKASCLGADDAAGVWIMMEMIRASIPGHYIFHYGEERGGIGSNAIARETPEILDGIEAAIAFDRRGTTSVITHQGGRTCSDSFGESLAAQLPGYKIDPGGIYTDTRNYKHLVAECTNLSVGYFNEHTSREQLDVDHLIRLRDAMLQIEPSLFVIERDPKITETPMRSVGFGSFRSNLTIQDVLELYPRDAAQVLAEAGVKEADFIELVKRKRDERWTIQRATAA